MELGRVGPANRPCLHGELRHENGRGGWQRGTENPGHDPGPSIHPFIIHPSLYLSMLARPGGRATTSRTSRASLQDPKYEALDRLRIQ